MRMGILGLGFLGRARAGRRPSPPLGRHPLDALGCGGGVSSKLAFPPSYIRRPLGGEFDTSGLREFLGRALLPSPPHPPSLSPLSLSWGFPKGCVGGRSTPPLHAIVLREF
jgi:hypothetical protein